ncbi:MmgE/PrpD family protein [Chloroflexota bacterium]
MGAKTTREVAEWVCSTGYKDLGSEVVSYAKLLALSFLGMAVAGATIPFGKIVTRYIKEHGGPAEAGVIGGGFGTSAEYAALANGSLAHCTELEDDSLPDGLYSVGAWPTVFALGEKLKLPGKDVIEALVIGFEVASRLAIAGERAMVRGWTTSPSSLTIGSAAMAAKMLRLNVEETTWALSIAASQASGIGKQTGTGAHVVEAGFVGRNGICSAMLAKLGCTGNSTVLEGDAGFMDLWAEQPEFDLPLGDGFRIMEVGIKKHACCYLQQRNIDGIFDLIAEHNISWDDVESVEHGINHTVSLYLKYPQPETAEEARFSLAHSTAAAFLDKKVFLSSFTDEKVRDPVFREARKKVKVTVHPEWQGGFFTFASPVTIKMKDGTEYKQSCISAKGEPPNRLGINEAMKKYTDCMEFAGNFTPQQAEKAADMILALEELPDVSQLVSILTFPDSK